MNLALLIYLISIIGPIGELISAAAFCILILAIVLQIYKVTVWDDKSSYDSDEEILCKDNKIKNLDHKSIICISLSFFLALFSCFIPTKNEAYLIAGASIAQNVAIQAGSNPLMDKSLKILDQKLINILEEEQRNNEEPTEKIEEIESAPQASSSSDAILSDKQLKIITNSMIDILKDASNENVPDKDI